MKKRQNLISFMAGLLIFLVGIAAVIFYIYKRCRSEFNADFTDTLLWANASVESGHYFNPDYWYAYFLPFSGIPIMIPIVAVFGVTFFSHQLGMTIFVLIFAAVLFIFARSMDLTYGGSFALSGLTMIFMCASEVTRMIFYGHVIHYSLAVVFMCVAFSLLRRSDVFDPGSPAARKYTIAICIWCMLCCTNGVATFLLFFVPFAGSLLLERYLDKTPITYEKDKPLFRTLAGFAAGGLAGFVIKMIFFSSSTYEDSITALLPSDGWVWNQSPFLLEWIKALTDSTSVDVQMKSFEGIRILCLYVLALALLIIPVFAVISYRKIENRLLRLLILHYWIMFGTTMLSYSVSYALVSNWRLAHLLCTSAIVSMLYVHYMLKNKVYVRWVIIALPILAVSAIISLLTVKNIPSTVGYNETDQLIDIYKEHGLTRGYSVSFWNSANSANVLSDGQIIVSPIFLYPDGSYEVRRYQSEPWEYEDAPGVDKYFLVVEGDEIDYGAETLGKHKIEEIKFQDNKYIWVFDRNIFENLEPVYKVGE